MAKTEIKQPIVDEIAELLNGAKSVVLVDYCGLTVDQDTKFRKTMREANVIYKVYKNTLIRRAAEGTVYEAMSDILNGPTAIAVSKEDETSPARLVAATIKETQQKISFKGGVVDGKFYDEKGIAEFANIPSKEVLIGRLLGSMQSPIANFARVIKQIAEKDEEAA